MIMLSQKETELLKDLKSQEQLCVSKYTKYANEAASTELKSLFSSMAQVEREHLKSITELMSGNVMSVPSSINNGSNNHCAAYSYPNEQSRQNDSLLCQDMLVTEKHASALYNTCVFEFKNPQARKLLNHIQAEEQQHGEQLYAYMSANNMYS